MIKELVQKGLNAVGYDIVRFSTNYSSDELAVLKKSRGYTLTNPLRIVSLIDAVKYVTVNRIPGAIVECGVWRGGSIMAALYTLMDAKDMSREIYLFDTFEGMSAPSAKDVMFDGTAAASLLQSSECNEKKSNYWCCAGMADVLRNVSATGYPREKLHFIKGKVEDTVPEHAPESIALLRLDTDWYASTRHELVHLYPRLAPKGVLIIDDYGHWQGARDATDEYFATLSFTPLLGRIDYTGRMMVKV